MPGPVRRNGMREKEHEEYNVLTKWLLEKEIAAIKRVLFIQGKKF